MNKQLQKLSFIFLFLMLFSKILNAQVPLQPTGTGTEADPYLINNLSKLYWVAYQVYNNSNSFDGKYFKQTANIDAFATSTWFDNGSGGYYGWTPIGNEILSFWGDFDGDNYKISNLYINRPNTDRVGLFGGTHESLIKNTIIENFVITGKISVGGLVGNAWASTIDNCISSGIVSGNEKVGNLIGNINGDIKNSCSSGTVNNSGTFSGGLTGYVGNSTIDNCYSTSNVNGQSETGGLIGKVSAYNDLIINCYSTGDVIGTDWVGGLVGDCVVASIKNSYSSSSVSGVNKVGGLVGYNYQATSISNCFSTGTINGTAESGGLIGYNYNTPIDNCYSTSNVNGVTGVGGLIGINTYYSSVGYCFSTGSISGTSDVGGLLGGNQNYSSPINYSFWDTQTSGQNSSAGGGVGLITSQMKTLSIYLDSGWDFELETDNGIENIWDMDPNGIVNNGYPFLSWENGSTTALPVELTSFTANSSQNGVILNWETSTEVNNYGFDIERKLLDNDCEWKTLGFVEGHGNSNSPKEYTFVDNLIDVSADSAEYRLKQIDTDGNFEYYGTIAKVVFANITGIEEISLPSEFSLCQNYPNPFNPSTVIKYGIPEQSKVKIEIFNMLGQSVGILVNSDKSAGYHETTWNATNLPSGIYLISIKANGLSSNNNFTQVKKALLLK